MFVRSFVRHTLHRDLILKFYAWNQDKITGLVSFPYELYLFLLTNILDSSQQNISKSVWAGTLKLGTLIETRATKGP